ncbi:MAG: dihydroorotase [Gammaproteobacteria bacterium]|nr:dihydroorotase [Gammaproteobacteria bacterium]
MLETLTLTRPDDWHVHLREGAMLRLAARHTAARFGRVAVMPNLSRPVTTVARALAYRADIMAAAAGEHGGGDGDGDGDGDGEGDGGTGDETNTGGTNTGGNGDGDGETKTEFNPLMSLYLTDHTTPAEVAAAADCARIIAYKLYPAGATTHSDAGVTRVSYIMPALEAMAAHGIALQVHGEVTDPAVDVFDREAVFIKQVLAPLRRELPQLKIVLEHVTTAEGVDFVRAAGAGVAATITAHHLLFNRNAMFRGGLRPHAYCLPVAKRERHRAALVEAATGGERAFFLGSDSAPHTRAAKENACGCAGIYSAHAGVELYAEIFENAGALDKLEGFAAHHGADFYGLARNRGRLTLEKKPWQPPAAYALKDGDEVVPLRAGETLRWSLVEG